MKFEQTTRGETHLDQIKCVLESNPNQKEMEVNSVYAIVRRKLRRSWARNYSLNHCYVEEAKCSPVEGHLQDPEKA